jgi:two-component system chemotaxis response regulator CheY/two-component system response regulator (stage 0 sporulation protein A)
MVKVRHENPLNSEYGTAYDMGETKKLKTALVVDDNSDILSLLVELLEIKKFHVIGTGHNGEEAVTLYEKLRPDITFLDVIMPSTDGLYALSMIRKINPDAVVIMVTTDLSRDTSDRLDDLRANAIVYKPFDIDNLVKTVREIESSIGNKIKSFG